VSDDSSPEITPRELADRLAAGERIVVLDVREPHERGYCAMGVPATAVDLFVPMNSVPGRLAEVRGAAPEGTAIVVYCHHGVRSAAVAEWLTGQGVPGLLNLEGGVDEWSRRVDPSVPRY